MASRFAPALRRSGLVLAGAVVVFSALAAANAVPVGELSVGEIEEELQVNKHFCLENRMNMILWWNEYSNQG